MDATKLRTALTSTMALLAVALFVCGPLLLAGHEHGTNAQCAVCSLATTAFVSQSNAPVLASALPEIGSATIPDSELFSQSLPHSDTDRAPPVS